MEVHPDNVKSNASGVRSTPFLRMFLLTAIVGWSPAALADGARSLAHFAGGERALEGLVDFPDGEDDLTLVLNCRTVVSEKGSARHTFCFEHDRALDRLLESVYEAVGKSRLIPAVVDGKPVKVNILYRVLFVRRGTSTSVHVYENWGDDVEVLGFDYRAPQLSSGEGRLYKCFRHDAPLIARATIRISADGRPRGEASVEFAEGSMPSSACEEQLKKHLGDSAYIPAESDGEPVEATYTRVEGWVTSMQTN